MAELNLTVRHFLDSDAAGWDEVVNRSMNGTFLHSRRFLAYHGDRFHDQSIVVEDQTGRLFGVLPAAVDPNNAKSVISHPGLTYGGLVHGGQITGEASVTVMTEITRLFALEGFERFVYKAVPYIYHRMPEADDLYALHRAGSRLLRCDLSSTIDLEHRGAVKHGRQSALSRAKRAGVSLTDDWGNISQYWSMLEENLLRHGASPTHSLAEINQLHESFPDEIRLLAGTVDEELCAGALLFSSAQVLHTQYLASSATGRKASALDAVIAAAIDLASSEGRRYFNFGISTEDEGRVLNQNLYEFKRSFGAGGVTHEHYEVSL